jgi:hypothetical protein
MQRGAQGRQPSSLSRRPPPVRGRRVADCLQCRAHSNRDNPHPCQARDQLLRVSGLIFFAMRWWKIPTRSRSKPVSLGVSEFRPSCSRKVAIATSSGSFAILRASLAASTAARAVAVYAAGGVAALSTRRDAGAIKLLGQISWVSTDPAPTRFAVAAFGSWWLWKTVLVAVENCGK